ncbi:flavin reductase family protein [Anaerosinus gibii]|uniref:Flavin reductase n=1 Tax=Selenobaculum gibii TaxID=3054208 RepID=A0A9Y2ETX8_9FIRM|nr:flavin reductase [Selenobaculum gbiensis]WIW70685.1 flavin reductase [Selenobaculum gbiensis]
MTFKEIQAEDFVYSTFKTIGKDWLLVTAEKDGKANTMTASWGGLGVMWGKNVAYVVIRPQRYTKEFIDGADTLSLTVFDENYRKMLSYCGSVSGRDEDKIAKSGLTVAHENNTPYFNEAKIALLCKKLYAQEFKPECFIDQESKEKWYPGADYHTMYIVEIEKILVQE